MLEEERGPKRDLLRQAEEDLRTRMEQERARKRQMELLEVIEKKGEASPEDLARARALISGEGEKNSHVGDWRTEMNAPTAAPDENLNGFQRLMRESPVFQTSVRTGKATLLILADMVPIFGGLYSLSDLVNGGEGFAGINLTDGERLAIDRRIVRIGASAVPGPWAWVPPVYDLVGDLAGAGKQALSHLLQGDKKSALKTTIEAVPGVIGLGIKARDIHKAYKEGGGGAPPTPPPPPRP